MDGTLRAPGCTLVSDASRGTALLWMPRGGARGCGEGCDCAVSGTHDATRRDTAREHRPRHERLRRDESRDPAPKGRSACRVCACVRYPGVESADSSRVVSSAPGTWSSCSSGWASIADRIGVRVRRGRTARHKQDSWVSVVTSKAIDKCETGLWSHVGGRTEVGKVGSLELHHTAHC